ncbi:polysaccharide biosynthesis tyrosine autokinase [Paractinoplanes rishiriensis]|uniref:Chromosome partitioning protein n=1 Tax=Paractinoplanes rishiriensis TaxID=1050105 RepID=A0A919K1G5_9ACTN|nr:polysaccharide biosynthesis tyrosine autokinase [Actinoplanes rishiriensis]GIE97300.1 chromosome partitioning protein [Actinoplanes rishiriensis]
MELRNYLRVARRQWWVMAVAVLFALAVAVVVNAKTPREYASAVTFFVATPLPEGSSALEGSMFVATRLKTYSQLLTGEKLAKTIAAQTGVDLTPGEISNRIKVATEGDTVLIGVTVTDRSPERAQLIAESLTIHFVALVNSLETPADDKSPNIRIDVLVPPRLEDGPVVPRSAHNLALSVAVGLLLGAALAVLREIADQSVRDAEVLAGLTGAPVLALIPRDRAAPRKGGPFVSDSRSPRAEALRQLRTNVQYADRDRPVKTLAVTSAMPGEGRSATACGLAILFAEAGQRVLIVDAELRRPRLAAFLGREGSAGLTTVLLGAASLDQVLQPWGTGLWLLSSGHRPPNPSELLGSQRMADLLDELRGRFDMIIVDSPPLLPVADGAVVAARADGALLLVRARKTTAAQVAAAVRALTAVDARLLGTVFTMVPAKGPRWRTAPPPVADTAGPPGQWNSLALSVAA